MQAYPDSLPAFRDCWVDDGSREKTSLTKVQSQTMWMRRDQGSNMRGFSWRRRVDFRKKREERVRNGILLQESGHLVIEHVAYPLQVASPLGGRQAH
jgi:hypothetical protein